MPIVFNARDVARLAGGKFLDDLKHCLRRSPLREQVRAAPVFRNKPEDVEVTQRLARRSRNFFHVTKAPLAVDERAFLLAPTGGGQNQVRALGRVGGREHVLHDEEFEFVEDGV